MWVPATVRHASEDALGLYALGDLPESQGLRMAAHLAGCSRCEEELKRTEKLIARLRLILEYSSGAWMERADG